MAEIVEIPFRKIRGTPEWKREQEKLREAVDVIERHLAESGMLPRTAEVASRQSPVAREDAEKSRSLDSRGHDSPALARDDNLGLGSKPLARDDNPYESDEMLERITPAMIRRYRFLRLLEEKGQVSRVMCAEKRSDGRACRYPAVEGTTRCRAHAEWQASALGHLPFPDDALGLQRLMTRLLGRLLYEKLDPAQVRVATDLCREMRRNLEACRREAEESEAEFFL